MRSYPGLVLSLKRILLVTFNNWIRKQADSAPFDLKIDTQARYDRESSS